MFENFIFKAYFKKTTVDQNTYTDQRRSLNDLKIKMYLLQTSDLTVLQNTETKAFSQEAFRKEKIRKSGSPPPPPPEKNVYPNLQLA